MAKNGHGKYGISIDNFISINLIFLKSSNFCGLLINTGYIFLLITQLTYFLLDILELDVLYFYECCDLTKKVYLTGAVQLFQSSTNKLQRDRDSQRHEI